MFLISVLTIDSLIRPWQSTYSHLCCYYRDFCYLQLFIYSTTWPFFNVNQRLRKKINIILYVSEVNLLSVYTHCVFNYISLLLTVCSESLWYGASLNSSFVFYAWLTSHYLLLGLLTLCITLRYSVSSRLRLCHHIDIPWNFCLLLVEFTYLFWLKPNIWLYHEGSDVRSVSPLCE